MEDKNNAVDEFLGDLKNNDGDGVFEPSKDNPFEGQDIINEDFKEEEVKDDKPLPLHKDPKVQRFIEKEVSKRIAEFKPEKEEGKFVREVVGDDIDDVLVRIIGNDTPEKVSAIKDFKKVLLEREEKGAERALRELDARRQAEAEAERKAEEELQQGFETIEDNFNVDLTSKAPQARKLRGEFIDFVKKIAPKDEYGEVVDYPDFEETFKLFQERAKPQPNTRARELASRSMTRTSDASTIPASEGKSWKDVDKVFSRMFK